MGRSVDYLSNAAIVAYCSPEFMEDGQDESSGYFDWDEFKEDLISQLQQAFPSLEEVDNRWCGRETSIILENGLVEIGLSEYCGLVSVSIRPNLALDPPPYDLANRWINRIKPKFLGIVKIYNGLTSIGRFSNGEQVFETMK